jgi:hypothetical protein
MDCVRTRKDLYNVSQYPGMGSEERNRHEL